MNRRNKRILLIILLILIVSTALILAKFSSVTAGNVSNQNIGSGISDGDSEGKNPSAAPGGFMGNESVTWSLIKLLGALLVVVLAIYGFLYLLKFMMGQKFSGNRDKQLLEIIETRYVAQKKSISLIRFSNRAILIGVCDGGITPLAELNPEETAHLITEGPAVKSTSAFKNVLMDARSKLMAISVKRMKPAEVSHG